MKFLPIVGMVLLAGCGAATKESTTAEPSQEEKQTSEWQLSDGPGRAYIGDGAQSSIRIEVTPIVSTLDPSKSDRFLLRGSGIDGELNNVVLVAEWKEQFGKGDFTTIVHGAPVSLLGLFGHNTRTGSAHYWGHFSTETFNQPMTRLVLDKSTAVDAAKMLEQYQEQLTSGLGAQLAPIDRTNREKQQTKQFDKWMADLAKACDITFKIDWDTIEDSWFASRRISLNCVQMSGVLENFCNRFPDRITSLSKTNVITCKLHSPELEGTSEYKWEEDGSLTFLPGRRDSSSNSLTELRLATGEQDEVLRHKNGYIILKLVGDKKDVYVSGDGSTFNLEGSTVLNDSANSVLHSEAVRAGIGIIPGGDWEYTCDGKSEPLETLVGEKRTQILDSAQYDQEPKLKRIPYFLARDSRGTYYYVDRYRRDLGGKRYRVFVGRRGQLKLSKLKGVVEDTEGTIFSTKNGELRMVVDKKVPAVWIRGRKKMELTSVNVFSNRRLIFDELGVYFGSEYSQLCGD